MKKILLVFGTRPEAIKMAPLVKAFQAYPGKFRTEVCVTGQHREMLDQVLQLFRIQPDYDLNVMKNGQDLYDISAAVLLGMRGVLQEAKPDLVLVHGDTTTSTAAALASYYQKIEIGHVEAGLRTHDIYSPWPEEMNRQMTARLSAYHFAPTYLSRQNLLAEGIDGEKIFVTGNTIIDSLQWVIEKIKNDQSIRNQILKKLENEGIPNELSDSWIMGQRNLILITGHRRENFGQGFIHLCEAIKELAHLFPGFDFVYPMHLNPNVRKAIQMVFGKPSEIHGKYGIQNICLTEPLEYLPFVYLMNLSYLVLTDSGGIQEEAPGLGKPVLVMRNTTERPEALEAGAVRLVGTDKHAIIGNVSELILDTEAYRAMSKAVNPYGDGHACRRIINSLLKCQWEQVP